jgi:hypothetical protein
MTDEKLALVHKGMKADILESCEKGFEALKGALNEALQQIQNDKIAALEARIAALEPKDAVVEEPTVQ